MPATLQIQINGQLRTIEGLATPTSLDRLVEVLGLKADRIAVEHNGSIAPRSTWPATTLQDGDKLEVVHFVGGGLR